MPGYGLRGTDHKFEANDERSFAFLIRIFDQLMAAQNKQAI